MKSLTLFSLLFLYAIQGTALAQWKTENYQLKGGWNAIYVHGDASYTTLDDLLSVGSAAEILEVWRWNQGSSSVLYTESPAVQSPGTPEWSIWKRGDAANNTLSKLTANAGYLVRCSGTSTDAYTVGIKLSPRPPKAQWVREGANLLSFQTKSTSPTTFYNFFSQGFPAPVASGSDIYKYLGGDLSTTNPFKIFSPSYEPLNRNQAYWFESQVVSNYHGPIEVELSNPLGIIFANEGSVVSLKLKNRTNQVQTLTITGRFGESPPLGQPTADGGFLYLATRAFDPQQVRYVNTFLDYGTEVILQPNETEELKLVINKPGNSPGNPDVAEASPGTLFQYIMRITDAAGMMEIDLPVSFTKGSLAGLWLGQINVTHIPYTPRAQAEISGGVLTAVNLVGRQPEGYTQAPTIAVSPPHELGTPANQQGTQATVEAVISDGVISAFSVTNAGSGYEKAPRVSISAPPATSTTPLPKPMTLRVLLHRDDDAKFRLLSHVFMGQLKVSGELGLTTKESLLDPESLGGASRFSVAHLPLDTNKLGTGNETGTLTHTISIPFNDPTNPFVHQYHPDHDNLDARFENPLSAGDESPDITRTLEFQFTATEPTGGATPLGWGVTILGGVFTETLEGIHSDPITLQGDFQIQRVSSIPTLSISN